jgi:nitrogen fixation NifU-like protein
VTSFSDLRDLYQEIILDHNRSPRNKGVLDEPTGKAVGHNPLCGDTVEVTLVAKDGLIQEVRFEGQGCAISTASASLMTQAVKGKPVEEALQDVMRLTKGLTSDPGEFSALAEKHDEVAALSGVRDYPVRIKCATLAWHTLAAALRGESEAVDKEAP